MYTEDHTEICRHSAYLMDMVINMLVFIYTYVCIYVNVMSINTHAARHPQQHTPEKMSALGGLDP